MSKKTRLGASLRISLDDGSGCHGRLRGYGGGGGGKKKITVRENHKLNRSAKVEGAKYALKVRKPRRFCAQVGTYASEVKMVSAEVK